MIRTSGTRPRSTRLARVRDYDAPALGYSCQTLLQIRVLPDRSGDSPTTSALCRPVASRSRGVEDDVRALLALPDHYKFLFRFRRNGSQRFIAPVFQNERDGGPQVVQAFFMRQALPVGTGYFGAIGDIPRAVLLDNRCKFVPHVRILPLWESRSLAIAPDKRGSR